MGGQDRLKGKIIRVGHMGDVRNEDMLALFEALSEKLARQSEWSNLRNQFARELEKANVLFP
jgi:aspartate aminotransferase-like enzyme